MKTISRYYASDCRVGVYVAEQIMAEDNEGEGRTALNKKIMVVDDDFLIAITMRDILEIAGYERVNMYLDPTEALEDIRRGERPDIVITDFNMPRLNGVELLKRIKEIDPGIRGFIVSSDAPTAMAAGPDCTVIDKGVNFPEALVACVRQIPDKE
jgi:DNA-binding NtrC family response regulator